MSTATATKKASTKSTTPSKVVPRPETNETHGPALNVECPTCGAEPHRVCKTTGKRVRVTAPHATRVAAAAAAKPTPAERAARTAQRIADAITASSTPQAAFVDAATAILSGKAPSRKAAAAAEFKAYAEAAERDAETDAFAAPHAPQPKHPGSMDRLTRLAAAKAENETIREWKAAGSVEPRPATPVLDWMSDPAERTRQGEPRRKASSGTSTCRTPEQEAEVARIITERRTAGDSWVKVAVALDAAALPTRSGGQWWDATAYETARRMGLDVFAKPAKQAQPVVQAVPAEPAAKRTRPAAKTSVAAATQVKPSRRSKAAAAA